MDSGDDVWLFNVLEQWWLHIITSVLFVSAVPAVMVGAKTCVEETAVAVHGTATLAQCKSNSYMSLCDFGVPGDGQWILSCALVGVFFRKIY